MKMRPIIDCIMPLVLCAPAWAQFEAMPGAAMGVVRGRVVAWTSSDGAGTIEIREDGKVRVCRFDAQTDFERERMRVAVTSIDPGDWVEMIADRVTGSIQCYARTVETGRGADRAMPTESFAPRGDIRFGGLVIVVADSSLTVRTTAGPIRLALRPDTRYFDNGTSVDSRALLNRHVFVRAGRNVAGDLEAYRVMCGEIVAAK